LTPLKGIIGPQDSIEIPVLRAIDDANYGILLDGIDVTAFSDVINNRLTLRPPEALANGSHQLILVANDQPTIPIGQWSFVVQSNFQADFQA
jgi:hypothetical protein